MKGKEVREIPASEINIQVSNQNHKLIFFIHKYSHKSFVQTGPKQMLILDCKTFSFQKSQFFLALKIKTHPFPLWCSLAVYNFLHKTFTLNQSKIISNVSKLELLVSLKLLSVPWILSLVGFSVWWVQLHTLLTVLCYRIPTLNTIWETQNKEQNKRCISN